MTSLEQEILPNRDKFGQDPFGYSTLAWHKWGLARTLAGFPIDLEIPPTSEDLKFPLLWLTQAHSMSEAARIVIESQPSFQSMPNLLKGVCDSQYCAIALMLVGYSLEICLKGMLIFKKGVETYTSEERKYMHHRLTKLAEFIPDLTEKDKATLQNLTSFIMWAGRYPDPGSGREDNVEEIFTLSEQFEISAKDLFETSAKVMKYTNKIIEEYQ